MKQTKTLLLTCLFLLCMVISKISMAQSPPGVYTNIATGTQTLNNDTIKGTDKWYRWVADTGVAHIGIVLKQQGINYQLAKAELYTVNSGTLVLAFRDTLVEVGDSMLNLYAGYIAPNTELYIKVLNASGSCTSCAFNEPLVTLKVENVMVGCAPVTPCDMVSNGGFESLQAGAQCGGYHLGQIEDCWFEYEASADVFKRNCSANAGINNLGTNTYGFSPVLNSHSPSPNNTIAGFISTNNPNYNESIQTLLINPLVAGRTYSLSFWVLNYCGPSTEMVTVNPAFQPCWFSVAASPNIMTASASGPTFPVGTTGIYDVAITSLNTWSLCTYVFVHSGAPCNNLLLGPNLGANVSSGFMNVTTSRQMYMALDDVSLIDITPISITGTQNHLNCDNNIATYTLSAHGINTFSWSPGGANTNPIVVTPTVSTTYSVAGEYPIGCFKSTTYQVTILPSSQGTITATPSTAICPGTAVTLSTTGTNFNPTHNVWTPGPCTPASCVFYTIAVSPTVTTTYSVHLDNANGCDRDITKTITVLTPSNAITVTGNTIICTGGQTTTLTASGGSTYTWTPNGTVHTSTIAVSPTVTTAYTVTGTYTCGGTATTVVTVSVTPPPTLTITSSATAICVGNSVTLSASGANTYTWYPGALTGTSVTVTPTATTIYTLTGANGICSNTKTISISINPNATITVNSATICAGATATLTASGGTLYFWSNGPVNTPSVAVSPTVSTYYTVIGFDSNGCPGSAVSTVSVIPNILPGAFTINSSAGYPIVANGTGTNTVGFSSTITNTTGLTFNWSNGVSTPTANFAITQSQIVNLIVTTPYCGSSSQSVCVNYVAAICSNTYATLPSTLTNTTLTNLTYKVPANATITVTGTVNVIGSTFLMGTNSAIVITAGSSLIFSNSKVYSCDGMWYGIKTLYTKFIAANVEIRNTTIEDAYKAVDADNASGTIKPSVYSNGGSIFNKNYIDFSLKHTTAQTGTNSAFYLEHINMTSQTSTTSPGANLKCSSYYNPSIKSRSYAGIYAENAGTISFTSNTAYGNNVVKNKDYGLYLKKTEADVYNVNFSDMEGFVTQDCDPATGLCTNSTPVGVAIFSNGTSNFLNVKPLGGSTTVNATFSNVSFGILASKTSSVDVQYCSFDNPLQKSVITGAITKSYGDYAVYLLDVNGTARVNKNTINKTYTGVSFNYSVATTNTLFVLSAGQNTITAGTGTLTTGVEIVAAVTTTFNGSVTNEVVAANTITNANLTGIRTTNVKGGLCISGNTISLTSTNGTKDGILLNGGNNNVRVDNNTINGNLTSTNVAAFNANSCGIRSINSAGCKIQCNTVKQIGKGIEYNGGNSSPGDGFFKNTLQFPIRRGLVLSNGGLIGMQGSNTGTVTGASANLWTNGWPTASTADPNQTLVGGPLPTSIASNAFFSSLWVRSTEAPYDNYFASPSSLPNIYATGNGINTFTTAIVSDYTNCPSMLTQGAKMSGTSSTGNSIEDRDADFVNYVNALLPAASTSLTPQDKYMLKQFMFDDLTQEPSANATLVNFYNQLQNTAIDAYADIDDLLASGNVALANSKNTQAVTTNDINQTQHDYNALYLNGINTQSDFDQLNYLAKLCPNQYGNAVFQARALLQILTYQYVEYNDSCYTDKLNSRFGYSDAEESSVSVADGVQAKLFPNPNNGNFTLAYDLKKNNEATVFIIDVTGKEVYQSTIDNLESIKQVNISNLQTGIYFIQLINNKTLLWTDKLMISK